MYKVVFSNTGDSLDICVEHMEVMEYWITQINSDNKNLFEPVSSTFPPAELMIQITENIGIVNDFLIKFGITPLLNKNSDWLNQDNLNILHEQWVKIQHKYKIVELFKMLPNNVVKKFHDINHLIHRIERPIQIDYLNDSVNTWQTINPFGSDILTFGRSHIELHYQNLGRSTFEKWQHYDENIVDTDTNNFTHFGGLVQFNLCRPIYQTAPVNYIKYCKSKNIKPYGNNLALGNFTESLTTLRHIFQRNVAIENNRISFEI